MEQQFWSFRSLFSPFSVVKSLTSIPDATGYPIAWLPDSLTPTPRSFPDPTFPVFSGTLERSITSSGILNRTPVDRGCSDDQEGRGGTDLLTKKGRHRETQPVSRQDRLDDDLNRSDGWHRNRLQRRETPIIFQNIRTTMGVGRRNPSPHKWVYYLKRDERVLDQVLRIFQSQDSSDREKRCRSRIRDGTELKPGPGFRTNSPES